MKLTIYNTMLLTKTNVDDLTLGNNSLTIIAIPLVPPVAKLFGFSIKLKLIANRNDPINSIRNLFQKFLEHISSINSL